MLGSGPRAVTITLPDWEKLSQVQSEPNKQTFVSGYIKLCCLINIETGNNIYLFISKYSLLRLHLVSRKIFTYFQWGVETNLAKIQNHNTVLYSDIIKKKTPLK